MDEQPLGRFMVVVKKGPARGDLYELEQTTYYQVIDNHSTEVVMSFRGEMEASLSTSTGLWDDYHFSGVCEVTIAPDEQSVIVKYCDGREEALPLPQ